MKPIKVADPMATPTTDDAASQNTSSLVLCGARTRQGGVCRHIAMRNGKCRFHGGLSTGPRTAEGIESHRKAVTRHGGQSQAARKFRAMVRQLRADARRMCEMV